MVDVARRCVLGVAGGSLDAGGSWAQTDSNVRAMAAERERWTAEILNKYASSTGATVLHDLSMPGQRVQANIDHAVVSGSKVYLLDTKWWKPGFYWTLGGVSRVGLHKNLNLDKQTIDMGINQVTGMLINAGCPASSITGIVVVWPSQQHKKTSTWALDLPGAGTIPAAGLDRWAKSHMSKRRTADPQIVQHLANLLKTPPRPTGHVAAGVPD